MVVAGIGGSALVCVGKNVAVVDELFVPYNRGEQEECCASPDTPSKNGR